MLGDWVTFLLLFTGGDLQMIPSPSPTPPQLSPFCRETEHQPVSEELRYALVWCQLRD